MQLQRNEILTGLLVIGTIGVIAFLLVLLGAPGLFRPLVNYGVYFDNAAGIKPGAVVMLAGRKIGQVQKLYSPLTATEEKQAQQAAAAIHSPEPNASPSPAPRFEARVDVQVDKSAKVYRDTKAQMIQLGLLGDMAIDFTQGTKESGRAKDGDRFAANATRFGRSRGENAGGHQAGRERGDQHDERPSEHRPKSQQTHREKLRTQSRSHAIQDIWRTPLRSYEA